MASQAIKSREPILGYEITERIGAGGYGEVWRATAPGGLTKAIKIVYGYLDDERAKRELKALSRVKQVRHPFLLSLERIEVVDGQLVIVTELADMSLKDRHEQCKAAGMVGIPRDELLVYMHDAADALDYMREKYSLQHLDIKPENLLVVGGHVKVADFGLVKDIEDTRASMMGGLTPLYASPEVFDDRPSQCSDQYSLAIVYQELLTDTVPFPGKTTAQLAAQHLQSRARLTALPPQDKPVIERALAKEPDKRFPDCRAMVAALIAAGKPAGETQSPAVTGLDTTPLATGDTHQVRPASVPEVPAVEPGPMRTQTFDECRAPAQPASVARAPLPRRDPVSAPQTGLSRGAPAPAATVAGRPIAPPTVDEPRVLPPAPAPRRRSAPVAEELPPLVVQPGAYLRPALFVGVGGTATMVLGHLRRRLVDRFGSLEAVPAIRILAADTDAEALAEASGDGHEMSLAAAETLALPLRKSEDYRCGSGKLLAWLSRRWLYNIPRSLETEGLRPLGRLAMVDHGATLVERLDGALRAITDPAAITTSAQHAGQEFRDGTPRVVLVASISGGSGSGMAADVAYSLKKLLSDRGLSDNSLSIVLLHSTGRNPAAHDLALANAYAALGELLHYFERGYPGEAACGAPPLTADHAGLPGMYLAHIGDELGEGDLALAAESVAEYLYAGNFSVAGNWLDAARVPTSAEVAEDGVLPDATVRTFGICHLGCSREQIAAAANQICVALVERWGGERTSRRSDTTAVPGTVAAPQAETATWSNAEIERVARLRAAPMSLSIDDVVHGLEQAARNTLGRDAQSYIHDLVTRLLADPAEHHSEQENADDERHPLLVEIDRRLGPRSANDEDESSGALAAALESYLKDEVRSQAASVRAWAMELTNESGARLKGAARGVECVAKHIRELRDTAQAMRSRAIEELRTIAVGIVKGKPRARGWGANQAGADQKTRLLQYAERKLLDTLLADVVKFAQSLSWELASIVEKLKEAQHDLAQLAMQFTPDPAARQHVAQPRSKAATRLATAVDDLLRDQLPMLIAECELFFHNEFLPRHGGLCGGLAKGTEFTAELVAELHRRSRAVVEGAVRSAAVGRKMLEHDTGPQASHELLRACLQEALPGLNGCGGARRLLVVAPSEHDAQTFAQSITAVTSQTPSVVVDPASDPVLCYEVASLPLWKVAASLVDEQPHCAELAARLHTRCDIDWSPLGAHS